MLRVATRVGLAVFLLLTVGCSGVAPAEKAPPRWQVGYWLWDRYGSRRSVGKTAVDVLYVHAGSISRAHYGGTWGVYGSWPKELPRANEYWAVFRANEPRIPQGAAAKALAMRVTEMQQEAARRGIKLSGVQLDIDSPTGSLSDYAIFLRVVKAELPKGVGLSITGLLDWFRPGTAVAEVVAAVDEFVPQFYDTETSYGRTAIATQIVAAKWAPQFNRFGKRYKVGISTFGRARVSELGGRSDSISPDLAPYQLATASGLELDASRNPAGELILRYKAIKKTRLGYRDLERGSQVEFVMATAESVRDSVARARKFGGHCTGVVFFRWPTATETLALPPEVVLRAMDGNEDPGPKVELRVTDRKCASVHCADLAVVGVPLWHETAMRYSVESSTEFDYFLPDGNSPVRLAGPSRLEVTIPPYAGATEIVLGTAVAGTKATYTLKETP